MEDLQSSDKGISTRGSNQSTRGEKDRENAIITLGLRNGLIWPLTVQGAEILLQAVKDGKEPIYLTIPIAVGGFKPFISVERETSLDIAEACTGSSSNPQVID